MNILLAVLFASLSIWDYPARQLRHEQLRSQFVQAVREGDTATMLETCRKGIELLPDDPTWHYNLACSQAYLKNPEPAFEELEKAIDLGFRNPDMIAKDNDLKRLRDLPRFKELVEYAREIQTRPIMLGPMASCDATGVFGHSVMLGEQNFAWDFDAGCFQARLVLTPPTAGLNAPNNLGDLYMNRDGSHSPLKAASYPGITIVQLDAEGKARGMDLNAPNILFPYPVFGNCSRAFTQGPYWRSLPRALMTTESFRLKTMLRFYLSNQIWVFPANKDYGLSATCGDVFMSVAPYWIQTEGISYSDQYYLKAALEVSRNLTPEVKKEVVRRGALAPTIQKILRRSLYSCTNDADYVTSLAHPTAFPPRGLDMKRLTALARGLTVSSIPPIAALQVSTPALKDPPVFPECTYMTPLAVAYVLRAEEPLRTFTIRARGASEFKFAVVHGPVEPLKLRQITGDMAELTIPKAILSPTNRVDLAVFARNPGTDWGAPSFVSFSAVDPKAPYSDPALTPNVQ